MNPTAHQSLYKPLLLPFLWAQHSTTGGHKVGLSNTYWRPAELFKRLHVVCDFCPSKKKKLHATSFGHKLSTIFSFICFECTKYSFTTETQFRLKKIRKQRLFLLLHSSLFITVIHGNIFPWSSAIITERGDHHHSLSETQTNHCPILHSVRCIKINNHSSSIDFEIHNMIAFIVHSHRLGTYYWTEWVVLHQSSFELQLEKLHQSKTSIALHTCKQTLFSRELKWDPWQNSWQHLPTLIMIFFFFFGMFWKHWIWFT